MISLSINHRDWIGIGGGSTRHVLEDISLEYGLFRNLMIVGEGRKLKRTELSVPYF